MPAILKRTSHVRARGIGGRESMGSSGGDNRHDRRNAMTCGIEQRVGAKHGDEHGLEAISDATQCPTVALAAGAQTGIVLLAARIPANRALGPVVAGVAQGRRSEERRVGKECRSRW